MNLNLVVILWSMAAATALTLALVHGLVWIFDRKYLGSLLLAVFALGVGFLAPTEMGMMNAQGPEEYGQWVRWFHVPLFVSIVGLVLFVRVHFGTGRAWMAWTIIGARVVVVVVNFCVEPNFNWREITTLRQIPFLGEHVSGVGQAVVRSWQWLPTASVLLLSCFVVDASVTLWRKGNRNERRIAAVLGGGISFAVITMVAETQLVVWGVVEMPVMLSPQFLIATIVITFELSRDLLLGRKAQLESLELRRELAHIGRVNLLGQLAPTLAHELNQPLSAILRNAEAADILLGMPGPDVQELRAIMADIHRDDLRASEVIERMRALLRRRTVESRPVTVEALAQDVISLVHADAVARRVTVQNQIPPGLPPVEGDRVQLFQVLLNLLVNGMDALNGVQEDARNITVAARRATNRMVEVAVIDSGAGIPPEAMRRLFSPFFTTKSSGMGLGLSVSRTIVEAHGGRLWAENNALRGATFRFVLPVAGQPMP
jgi:signal transduction histidine kinase